VNLSNIGRHQAMRSEVAQKISWILQTFIVVLPKTCSLSCSAASKASLSFVAPGNQFCQGFVVIHVIPLVLCLRLALLAIYAWVGSEGSVSSGWAVIEYTACGDTCSSFLAQERSRSRSVVVSKRPRAWETLLVDPSLSELEYPANHCFELFICI
jgi:hypothetical protein